jgi:cell shape-determining protein MreD
MKSISFVLFGFALIIFQTSVLPFWFADLPGCDLMMMLIVYLGMYHELKVSMPAVLILGYVIDNLSGAPFGIYTSVYPWSLLTVRWIVNLLHAGNRLLIVFMPVVGLIVVNALFWLLLHVAQPGFRNPPGGGSVLGKQFLLALIMGPVIIVSFEKIYSLFSRWVRKFKYRQGAQA